MKTESSKLNSVAEANARGQRGLEDYIAYCGIVLVDLSRTRSEQGAAANLPADFFSSITGQIANAANFCFKLPSHPFESGPEVKP